MSDLVQVHGEVADAACPHCGAAVAEDQRYCLSCGRPCAALRLPFLDVLQGGPAQGGLEASGGAGNGYLPPLPSSAQHAPLQRYTGLFALLGVLLLTGVIGLLIGHWAAGSSGPAGPAVVKVEGLGGASPTAAALTTTTSTSSTASAKEIEHESKQEERETAASNLAKPVKSSASAVKRLSKLTGKRYEREINKLANGPAPIETGG